MTTKPFSCKIVVRSPSIFYKKTMLLYLVEKMPASIYTNKFQEYSNLYNDANRSPE